MERKKYDRAVRISEHVYWVGTYDSRDKFQCNPYLIKVDGEAVLIDPGSVIYYPSYLKKIEMLVDLKAVSYIICQHQDPDVCGNIAQLTNALRAEGNRSAKIITHRRTAALIRHYSDDLTFKFSNEFPNKRVTIGQNSTLEFIHTPYLHAPGAIATYFDTDKILFSSDIFGGMTENWALDAGSDYFQEIAMFHEEYMPAKEILLFTMTQFERYEIDKIAPQHGSVIKHRQARELIERFKNFECGLFIDQSFRDELQAARKQIETQNRIMNRELTMAGQFQKALLPDPEKIKIEKQLDIAFLFEPYSQVSGDFLIIDNINDRYLGIMVVDVVDHGVTSGLATIQLKTLFETYKHMSFSPAEVLKEINEHAFSLSENDIFFTAVYMIYDRENSTVTIASAGGVPPVYYNCAADESVLLELEGTAVGVFKGAAYRIIDKHFSFAPGDCLIFQTDGLMDVADPIGVPFTRAKSQTKIMRAIAPDKQAREILEDITENVKRHKGSPKPFDDDATMVVFKLRK